MTPTIVELNTLARQRLEILLKTVLHNTPSLELKSSMEYALFSQGKYLRPQLIYATGAIFNAPLDNLDIPAAAVELIHTYSLVHDDLPCMDDADLRRGKPSLHKAFNEGMAVLAGDAMHTLAMQLIASHPADLTAEKRLQMVATLSKACGPFGMAGGQAFDIDMMNDKNLPLDLLLNIYRLKTGALFSACIELGYLASHDESIANHNALLAFGDKIGLAFQIQDDLLDIEASSEQSGKTQGIDSMNQKVTYPILAGMSDAKEKVQTLYREALASINYLGSKAHLLRELAGEMLKRKK